MIENPYSVGDTVLASRSDDGESYEEAKVVDAYSLIIGADERPMVAVEFPDGQRVYLTANGPDVRPVENQQGEEDADG
jgi:hypothetical protein